MVDEHEGRIGSWSLTMFGESNHYDYPFPKELAITDDELKKPETGKKK